MLLLGQLLISFVVMTTSERKDPLLKETLPTKDPFELFSIWYKEFQESGSYLRPRSVYLATASRDGQPSLRTMTVVSHDHKGFVFSTHKPSRKFREMEENPKVALLFYWDVFERQVRVEGTVEFMSHEESSRIWYNLSRKTQLGFAVITNGSQIQDRDAMTDQYKESEKHFEGHEVIPKPSSWTGVRVVPRKFEFWQGQEDLLSDRFVFERSTEETSGDPEKEWIAGWLLYRKLP